MEDQGTPKLAVLERSSPKGYLRYIFPLRLQDNYDLYEVSRVVQAGYDALAKRISVVGYEAGLAQGRGSRDAPSTLSVAGGRGAATISLVRANFIRRELLLIWCIVHTAGDGRSFYSGPRSEQRIALVNVVREDREQVMQPSGTNSGRLEDYPKNTHYSRSRRRGAAQDDVAEKPGPGLPFHFSKESLAALKAEVSLANSTQPSDQSWISTNNALSALVWRIVIAVQSPLETLEGDPVSTFNVAIHRQQSTSPKSHPGNLGCFLEYVAISVLIGKMLSEQNIADPAVLIDKPSSRPTKASLTMSLHWLTSWRTLIT